MPMLFLTCRWSHHSCRTWESILPPVKGTGKSGSSGILEFYLLASFFTTFAHKSASLALSFFSSVGIHSSTFYRYFPHFFFRGNLGVGLRAGSRAGVVGPVSLLSSSSSSSSELRIWTQTYRRGRRRSDREMERARERNTGVFFCKTQKVEMGFGGRENMAALSFLLLLFLLLLLL